MTNIVLCLPFGTSKKCRAPWFGFWAMTIPAYLFFSLYFLIPNNFFWLNFIAPLGLFIVFYVRDVFFYTNLQVVQMIGGQKKAIKNGRAHDYWLTALWVGFISFAVLLSVSSFWEGRLAWTFVFTRFSMVWLLRATIKTQYAQPRPRYLSISLFFSLLIESILLVGWQF